MTVCYLLETTDLWGGVRVVFDQARALKKLGCDVIIRALGGNHGWYPHPVRIDYVNDLALPLTREVRPDVAIATFWTTVHPALTLNCRATFHLCQGYEGDSVEYAAKLQAIEEVYKIPLPKLTVGEWLTSRLMEVFGHEAFKIYTIGQIVDVEMYRPLPFWKRLSAKKESKSIRILISGLFDASVKAIADGLYAVSILRKDGYRIHLTRVSTFDTLEKESRITEINEYLCRIPPGEMANIYRMTDLFIAPSLSHEGFGLPFAEALACGVPSVATAIPSHMSFDEKHDYACFVPERDPGAIARAAINIVEGRRLRNHLRKRGIEVVRKNFRDVVVAERLRSAISGALHVQ